MEKKMKEKKQNGLFVLILTVVILLIAKFSLGKISELFWKTANQDSIFIPCRFENIEIPCPVNWLLYTTSNGNHGDKDVVAWVASTDPSMNLFISKRYSKTMNLDQLIAWGETRINQHQVIEISLTEKLSTPHLSGLMREYRYKTDTPIKVYEKKCKDVYFIHYDSAFIFTFCSDVNRWGEFEPIVDKMIEGVKFIE